MSTTEQLDLEVDGILEMSPARSAPSAVSAANPGKTGRLNYGLHDVVVRVPVSDKVKEAKRATIEGKPNILAAPSWQQTVALAPGKHAPTFSGAALSNTLTPAHLNSKDLRKLAGSTAVRADKDASTLDRTRSPTQAPGGWSTSTTLPSKSVSVSDFLTLFSARTHDGFFWSVAPSPILMCAAMVALSLSTALACAWPEGSLDRTPVQGLARGTYTLMPLWIWIYCIFWWFVQDALKSHVHRMRSARQQRVGSINLEREPAPCAGNLHALQGRGAARTCRLTPPGDTGAPGLLLRHYGLDRTAFAAGAVVASRFLAARVAEGAAQRVYDMVDVLRALPAASRGPQYNVVGNVVAAGPAAKAAKAAAAAVV
ncbi:putative proton ATPase 1B [Tetrabaena socialis]|uniref:Putative proton ATPase 1B n=1 Tax=Tetrabaena socialis TaxID=47790 RepID=A0A2J8AHQ3_9CHLO|nr:putative proton ATPase 1B [Tetrabaena socialis]|eukprot:PNH12031.1 putative proton ATPase 1B [Tetrabaena socialis]